MPVANAEPSEPATNRTAPTIRLYFRPSRNESQPLNSAPSAAPSIMLLTTHSCKRLLRVKWSVINGSAPAITPISSPNSKPATAAEIETNWFILRVSRNARGIKVESLIEVIISCLNSERRCMKLRETQKKCQAVKREDMDYMAGQ
ncbi:hypothetical protein D3C76_818130 [compost metagenome]